MSFNFRNYEQSVLGTELERLKISQATGVGILLDSVSTADA